MKISGILFKSAFAIAVIFTFLSCQQKIKTDERQLVVSILPQKFLVDKISGNYCHVEVMVPDGISPEMYEPAFSQMKNLQKAKIYFLLGNFQYERQWEQKFKDLNPDLSIVNTSNGLEQDDLIKENHYHHAHIDPHIWLSPSLYKKQATVVVGELKKAYPDKADDFQLNYENLCKEIDSLDRKIRAVWEKYSQPSFLIFHPSLSYYAKCYGLEQIAIENEGKEPGPAQLETIIRQASQLNIKHVLVQKELNPKMAGFIYKQLGGDAIVINPLQENWAEMMWQITLSVQNAMK